MLDLQDHNLVSTLEAGVLDSAFIISRVLVSRLVGTVPETSIHTTSTGNMSTMEDVFKAIAKETIKFAPGDEEVGSLLCSFSC